MLINDKHRIAFRSRSLLRTLLAVKKQLSLWDCSVFLSVRSYRNR